MDREILINYIQTAKGLNDKFNISAHTMNFIPTAEAKHLSNDISTSSSEDRAKHCPLQPVMSMFSKNCYIFTFMHY
jgi:hypothetical protein